MPDKPDRRLQILQALAEMLEKPQPEKITTAALASRLHVSEAALYRHFASKAQMYDGLIEFIEHTLFGLVNKIISEGPKGTRQLDAIIKLLLGFAEKNHGLTRVLIGEVLVNENVRLQARINQLHDRLEATLRQALRVAAASGEHAAEGDTSATANLLLCFVVGRWQQYAKSGFKRAPLEFWDQQRPRLLPG
ncbi:MAG: nucleoid occlusion factor SlmA [Burkholderiales bacterium]